MVCDLANAKAWDPFSKAAIIQTNLELAWYLPTQGDKNRANIIHSNINTLYTQHGPGHGIYTNEYNRLHSI